MSNKQKAYLIQIIWFVNFVVICFSWLFAHRNSLSSGDSGLILVSLGSLFGLLAAYLFLTQFMLISGAKFIESRWGLDRLARRHSLNGKIGFGLLLLHPFLINSGQTISQTGSFVPNYIENYFQLVQQSWQMTLAGIGIMLFFIIILTSVVMVRKRLKYELWYFIHLATYLAVLLPAFHQLQLGQTLNGLAWFKAYWICLYVLAFSTIIYFKWFRPLNLYLKHRFVVDEVTAESDSVVSIYVTGKNLDDFHYKAGQFNLWRFISKGLATQRHPFTISSSPGDNRLRLTVKNIGDGTEKLQKIKIGTPVVIDGPYGRFTDEVQTMKRRLFIAGGIGITPLASQLKDKSSKNDTLIYAVRSKNDMALRGELAQTKANLIAVFSEEKHKGALFGRVDKKLLSEKVKDIERHDVWLCGPPAMIGSVEKTLIELGVPSQQIHTELFRL